VSTQGTAVEQRSAASHSLPNWFIKYQDHAGLTILLVSLMGINAVVYGSGVVPDILRPQDWGALRTVLFVFFCGAGTVMPGLALRFGVAAFTGHWFRRALSAVLTLVYFVVEVWASVTERSLNTVTTPADRWLLQALHAPSLPFSPTVLAISLSLSIAVVGWGIVTTPPQQQDLVSLQNKLEAEQMRAEARAKRMSTNATGAATAAFKAASALRGRSESPAETSRVPVALMPAKPSNFGVSIVEDDPDDDDDDEDEDDQDDGRSLPTPTPPTLRATGTQGRFATPRGAVRTQGAQANSHRFQRVIGPEVLSHVVQARTPTLRTATA